MAVPSSLESGATIRRKVEGEIGFRANPKRNPESPAVSQWPATTASQPNSNLSAVRSPRAGIQNDRTPSPSFLAGTLNDFQALPPDMQCAPGPTQLLMVCNGRIRVFSKTGTVGPLSTDLETFFSSVMTPVSGNFVCDPRARYDRYNQQWIVTAMDVPNGGNSSNRILIAVGAGPTITATTVWSFFQFEPELVGATPNADTGTFADHPTLGVDKHALYIGCNTFERGTSHFAGSTGFVVQRSSLTPGGTPVVTAFRQLATQTTNGPITPLGVDNDDPTANEGYFLGVSSLNTGQLVLRRISDPGTSPTISPNILITVPTTAVPADAPHKGNNSASGTGGLETGGDRLLAATLHRNRVTGTTTLATAHNIGVDSAGVASAGGRAGIRWYEIGNLAGTPQLVQSGTIHDNAASNPNWYIVPTIAMSGQGRMIIGSTVTGANTYPSVHISERFSSTTAGTVGSTIVAKAGVGPYNPVADEGSLTKRWGDYSMVAVDPADDMTLWSIQQYTSAPNVYGVEILKHPAPPPAAVASVSPASAGAGTTLDLTITGTSSANSGFFDTDPDWSFGNRLKASFSGTGITVNSITFNSPTSLTVNATVSPSAALGARSLTITNPDGQSTLKFSAVTVVSTMQLTVPNVSAGIGATVNLSATLTKSGVSLAGKTVSFLVGGLSVGSTLTNTSGVAALTYTVPAGSVGSRAIQGVFAGDTTSPAVSGSGMLTTTKAPVVIAVPSGSGIAGQPLTLNAFLTRQTDNAPLAGRKLVFFVEGSSAGSAVTNSAGVASIPYTFSTRTAGGTKNIRATVATDANHLAGSGSGNLELTPVTDIFPGTVNTSYLANSGFRAFLRHGNVALEGKTVSFLVNGTPIGTAITNSAGLAFLPWTMTAGVGTHTWTASFAGDTTYSAASADAQLIIGKGITTMAIGNAPVKVGATGTIKATLKVGTTPIAGVPVAFSFDGTPIGTFITNSQGVVSTTRVAGELTGYFAFTAYFAGDANFMPLNRSGWWIVSQAFTKITGDIKSAAAGSSTTYGAVLRRTSDNAVLVGKTLEFKDSATLATLGTATTNASGRAEITLTAPAKGVKRSVRIEFAGDFSYSANFGTGSLTGN